jgi:hypothetical protein
VALTNYTELKVAIKEWLDRGSELDGFLDDYITLAEERHRKEVRMREMLVRETLVVNARFVALPARFLAARTLRLLTDPVTVPNLVTLDKMNRVRLESRGVPASFTVHVEIEFDVIPQQSYSGEIIYYKGVLPLSDSTATNTILANAPGCYLYGALVAASPQLMNDERIQVWEGMYKTSVNNANMVGSNAEQVGAPIITVAGQMP